jgi:hypothetical protein
MAVVLAGDSITISGAPVPAFSTSSDSSETVFPVGQYLQVGAASGTFARNAAIVPRLNAGNTQFYTTDSGTLLSGTWRVKGRTDEEFTIYGMQRVA